MQVHLRVGVDKAEGRWTGSDGVGGGQRIGGARRKEEEMKKERKEVIP